MWDQPHFTYVVVADEHVNQHLLVSIEDTVPGAMVYGRTDSGRKYRLHKVLSNGQDRDFARFEVFAPIHAAWLVEAELCQQNLGHSAETVNTDGITYWQQSDEWRGAMVEQGKQLAEYYVETGELMEHVPGIATPYQFMGIAWALSRPWVMDVWSGKTLGAILASLTRPGPILVVCPAKARHVWWSQVQEYTNLIPYRVRPKSDTRKKDQKVEEYLSECRTLNRRPFLVVGAESLADNMALVQNINPSVASRRHG